MAYELRQESLSHIGYPARSRGLSPGEVLPPCRSRLAVCYAIHGVGSGCMGYIIMTWMYDSGCVCMSHKPSAQCAFPWSYIIMNNLCSNLRIDSFLTDSCPKQLLLYFINLIVFNKPFEYIIYVNVLMINVISPNMLLPIILTDCHYGHGRKESSKILIYYSFLFRNNKITI